VAETIERLVVGPLATNCYILKSGAELAVIDPGGDAELILEKVGELGGVVKYVIDTHGHVDHIAANREVVEATGAELLIHELDAKLLALPDRNLSSLMGMKLTSPAPSRLLKEGDKVVVGEAEMTVLLTPGHTPGGICLLASAIRSSWTPSAGPTFRAGRTSRCRSRSISFRWCSGKTRCYTRATASRGDLAERCSSIRSSAAWWSDEREYDWIYSTGG
jgi:hypothetical protein